MPFKISLPKSSLVEIESPTNTWNKLTEHNRGALEMSTERIEETKRMANGTLRKYYIADKKSLGFCSRSTNSSKRYRLVS
jgi:hypothetical protein